MSQESGNGAASASTGSATAYATAGTTGCVRALAPVENPLRRAKGIAGPAPRQSEDEIVEALSALAGSVGR